MRTLMISAAVAVIAAFALPAAAQERLTPERVFSDPSLNGPSARSVTLSPDGELVAYLLPREDDVDVLDLWAAPVAGGEPFRLVDARALVSEEEAGELSEAERARRERMRISQRGVVDFAELLLSFRGLCEEILVAEQQVVFFGICQFAELSGPGFQQATFAGGSAEQEDSEEGTAGEAEEGCSGSCSGVVHGVLPKSVAGSSASFFRKAVSGICRMLW